MTAENHNDIIETLALLDRGQFIGKFSSRLNELVDKCLEVEKAGTLTLTLKVTPEGHGEISMAPAIKTNLPQRTIRATTMFQGPEGVLGTSDPGQTSLFNAEVLRPERKEMPVIEGVKRELPPHDPDTGEIDD